MNLAALMKPMVIAQSLKLIYKHIDFNPFDEGSDMRNLELYYKRHIKKAQ